MPAKSWSGSLRTAEKGMLPPKDAAVYTFHLGDTAYLGAEEYEICSFNEHAVGLRDMRYPLLTKEFPRETFDRMLRENPLNDRLIIRDKTRNHR